MRFIKKSKPRRHIGLSSLFIREFVAEKILSVCSSQSPMRSVET